MLPCLLPNILGDDSEMVESVNGHVTLAHPSEVQLRFFAAGTRLSLLCVAMVF